jgi:hypothetical protein
MCLLGSASPTYSRFSEGRRRKPATDYRASGGEFMAAGFRG